MWAWYGRPRRWAATLSRASTIDGSRSEIAVDVGFSSGNSIILAPRVFEGRRDPSVFT